MRPLLALVIMVGCGRDATPPEQAPAPAPAAPRPVSPAIDAAVPTGDVLAAGSEPRRALAYSFQPGAKVALAIETDLDRTGPTGSGPLPTMRLEYETVIAEVAPDGVATLKTTVKKVGMVPREGATVDPAQVVTQAAFLEGAVVTMRVAPDGTVRDSAITLAARDVTPAMTAEANQALEPFRSVPPLPRTPVGVGAKWKRTTLVTPGGVRIAHESEYEITAIEGTRVSYRLTATLGGADHQAIQGPDVALEVSNIRGDGAGQGTFDLATATATGEYTQTLSFDMTAAGERATAMLRAGYRTYGLQSAP